MKNSKLYIQILVICLLFTACKEASVKSDENSKIAEAEKLVEIENAPEKEDTEEMEASEKNLAYMDNVRKYELNGYKIKVEQINLMVHVDIETPNGKDLEQLKIPANSELLETKLIDCNKDKRPELFIITANTKRTGQDIYAYSLTPFSALPIHIVDESVAKSAGNEYKIVNNQLVRTSSLKGKSKNSVGYNLVAGEAGFRLEPHGMTMNELDEKVYGEFVTEGYPNEYWQKLTIEDNGLGEIVVKVTASKVKNNEPGCGFEGIGKLIDGQIRVGLRSVNEEMKGTIILRQEENGWSLSTVKEADRTELMYFCAGGGSLAGTYLRSTK